MLSRLKRSDNHYFYWVVAMSQKTALLLGGSGLIGRHCLNYLLNDEHYNQVMTLVRRPLLVEHPKLVQHQVNFSQLQDFKKMIQANDVYCCLGTTIKKAGSKEAFYEVDFRYPTEIAELSIANGAEHFLLVSAIGANPRSSIFYNRVKGEVEQAIVQYGFKRVTIFRPSLLLGKRPEWRLSEEFWKKFFRWFSFAFKGRLKKYQPIRGKAVAYAMVEVAKESADRKQVVESHHIQAIFDRRHT